MKTLLLLCCFLTPLFSAPAFASPPPDLSCLVFKKSPTAKAEKVPGPEALLVCKEAQPKDSTKSIGPVIVKYVVIPLAQMAAEELIKRVFDAYVAKYGTKPGKIHMHK